VRLLSHARNSNSRERAAQNIPVAKQGGREALYFQGEGSRTTPTSLCVASFACAMPLRSGSLHPLFHIEEDGATVFEHACKLGLEGIVSKRKGSRYSTGRSPDWLKARTRTRQR
jgi:bifunctional non-homologous end joining protein LigD